MSVSTINSIINKFKIFTSVILSTILFFCFAATAHSNSQLEVGDWDIDDDGRADALTDGLFFLRYTFGLRGDALISGLISSGSEYTTATEIERELALVYDASGDIDGDGNVDALTDGLLLLRYLFGLSGDTLTVGVVASNATRTTASELEGFISNLMPSAPYITLIGSAELAHEQATAYVDAGAVANDYADGSVEVSVSGSVDSDRAGVYVLTYTAVDSEGNEAKPVIRTVTVADTTPPVLYPPQDLETFALSARGNAASEDDISYFLQSAYAVDTVDTELAITNNAPDIFPLGLTTVVFSVSDSSGNIANSVSAKVFVKTSTNNFMANNADFAYEGRWDFTNLMEPLQYWQGSSISFSTNGSAVSIRFNATTNEEYRVIINGTLSLNRLQISPGLNQYLIAESLDPSIEHNIELLKSTNTGAVAFLGAEIVNGTISANESSPNTRLKIAYFGDSNMEGYSLYSEKDQGGMGTYYAYPSMTSRMLDADMQIMAKSGATLAGSGFNNIVSFIKSINWPNQVENLTDDFKPDVVVINAGANDIYSISNNREEVIKERYRQVIRNIRDFYGSEPYIVLMNAYGWDTNEPANYSNEITSEFSKVSTVYFPWCWEQWHGTMVEHAGQARILANHLTQLNPEWFIIHDPELFYPFSTENLISNGSFESVAKDNFNSFGWRYFEDSVERIYDAESAFDGDYFIQLDAGEYIHQGQDATGDLLPGSAPDDQTYEFSIMMRSNSSSAIAEVSMDFEGQALYGRGSTASKRFFVSDEWGKYSTEFAVADNSWKFYLVLKSQDGKIDFDQVELKIKD